MPNPRDRQGHDPLLECCLTKPLRLEGYEMHRFWKFLSATLLIPILLLAAAITLTIGWPPSSALAPGP